MIVYFYSKKCAKCKRLNSQFPGIVKEHLSFMEPNLVPVVRFPCSKFPEYCSLTMKITHFPTVRVYYRQRHYTTYLGKFEPFRLAKFLTQRVFYSSYIIGQSNYNIEHILGHKQLVALKLDPRLFRSEDRYSVESKDDESGRAEAELEAFRLLGFRAIHAHFYSTPDLQTLEETYSRFCRQKNPSHEVTGASFALINPDDDVCYLFEGSLVHAQYDGKLAPHKTQIDKALDFVKKHQHPLIVEFSEKRAIQYQKKNLPYVTYFTQEGSAIS